MPYRGRRTSEQADLSAIPLAQRERLACIDFYLQFMGEVSRRIIVEQFGVTSSMAVRDLAVYRDFMPNNMAYHNQKRRHIRLQSFSPLFTYDLPGALAAFKKIEDQNKRLLAYEVPYRQDRTQESCVSPICRAINLRQPVKAQYLSLSRGHSSRVIVPHSLIDSGTRWHVRAFDRDSGEFRDFVLSRFIEAVPLADPIDPRNESIESDYQWQKTVELTVVPHPDLTHPQVAMVDYGIAKEGFKMPTKAALAGYQLRRWCIDCSRKHRLNPREYQLWLANVSELTDVASLRIAPGYWSL